MPVPWWLSDQRIRTARTQMDAASPDLAPPPPGGTFTGWRCWRLTRSGYLLSPFASQGPHGTRVPWRAGVNVARCLDPVKRHAEPPQEGCECGIRALALPALAGCLTSVVGQHWHRVAAGLGAVGEVELSGRVIGRSPNDPAGSLRGSHARLVRLFVGERFAPMAEQMSTALEIPVQVGFSTIE